MSKPNTLKANFAVENKYEAFFTGGVVQFSEDGQSLLCQCGTKVQILDTHSGKVKTSISQAEEDEVTCFCLSPDDQILVVAGRSLLLRQWDWKENKLTRTWKFVLFTPVIKAIHTGPVSCMGYDSTSTLLATGGADSTIKVWDIIQQYCTHNLRGHEGIVTTVKFHPDTSKLQLFSAGEDYKIRIWSLTKSVCIAELDSHYSYITSLEFNMDCSILYSGARDKVVIEWDAVNFKKRKTFPVYEAVEGLLVLPKSKNTALNIENTEQHFVTAGDKGILRVWNSSTAQCTFSQSQLSTDEDDSQDKEDNQHVIIRLIYNKSLGAITTVTHDHNINLYDKTDLSLTKQLTGYNDDILDIKYAGPEDTHIVVATNSQLIKIYSVETWACQILQGHKDIVLALDVYKKGNMIVSGSKDNCVRVWKFDPNGISARCVAAGYGHTHAIGAVAISRMSASFIVSGCQDLTLKVWTLPGEFDDDETAALIPRATERAHDKDINSVTVSPNDKLIASGSQDKTAKLWSVSDLSLLGVFRGHKRGVWCVQFSPVDQCLATASADTTIKLWALSDFSCVKTFEGHESSVLRVNFLSRGMQLVSSGSDGLMKLWTIKTNECVKTFDAHDEKVWALAINKSEDNVVTGAGDSIITLWKDVTELEVAESRAKQEEFILQEQELLNLIHEKKFLKAIGLAITLEQPFRVLNILKEVMGTGTEAGEELSKTLSKLRDDQIDAILRFAGSWNTNSKHCHAAQLVISIILKTYTPEALAKFANIKSSLEGLLPYTERHFQRMDRLLQQSTFVDYTWNCMKLVGNESMDTGESSMIEPATNTLAKSEPKVDAKDESSDNDSDDDNSSEDVTVRREQLLKTMGTSSEDSSDSEGEDFTQPDDSEDEEEEGSDEVTGADVDMDSDGNSEDSEDDGSNDSGSDQSNMSDGEKGTRTRLTPSGDNDSESDSEEVLMQKLFTSKHQKCAGLTPKGTVSSRQTPRTDPTKRPRTRPSSAISKAKRRKSAVR